MRILIALIAMITPLQAQILRPIMTASTTSGGGGAIYTSATQCSAVNSTSTTCTIASGHLVAVIASAYNSAVPTCSFSDGTNTLTNTTHSPVLDTTSDRTLCIGYKLAETSCVAGCTFSVTWGGGGVTTYSISVWDVAYTGTASFAADADGSASSPTATPVTTPSVGTASGQFLLASLFPAGTISTQTQGGPWVYSSVYFGQVDSYILSSASGSVAVNFVDGSNPDTWASLGAAWK